MCFCNYKVMALDVEPSYAGAQFLQEIKTDVFGNESVLSAIEMLKLDETATRSGNCGSTWPEEQNIPEGADPSPCSDDSGHIECSNREGISAGENEYELVGFQFPVHRKNIGLIDKESELGADKAVTELAMDNSKDGACYIVRDICVDEGVHIDKKIIVENNGATKVSYIITENNEAKKERRNNREDPISESLTCSLMNGPSIPLFDKDDFEQFSSNYPEKMGDRFDAGDRIGLDFSSEKLSTFDEFLRRETSGRPPKRVDLLSFLDSSDEQEPDLSQQNIDQVKIEELSSPATTFGALAEEHNRSKDGVITIDCRSSTVASTGRPQNEKQSQCRHGSDNILDDDDGAAVVTSARSSYVRHFRGDSASSMLISLTEPVTSSGRITYVGNISHRSDSSTTSARSFAFPILQSEWNCSPVKMAKADRRQLRRRWCRRMGLFCCNF